jgi:hypothetical protein
VADGGWYAAVVADKRFKGSELKERVRAFAKAEIRGRLEELAKNYPKREGNVTIEIDAETIERFLDSPTGLQHWERYLRPIELRTPGLAPLLAELEKLSGSPEEQVIDQALQRLVRCPCGVSKNPGAGWVAELRRELQHAVGGHMRELTHFVLMVGGEKFGPFWRGQPTDRDLALLAVACGWESDTWARLRSPSEAVSDVAKTIRKVRQRKGGNLAKSPPARRGRPKNDRQK